MIIKMCVYEHMQCAPIFDVVPTNRWLDSGKQNKIVKYNYETKQQATAEHEQKQRSEQVKTWLERGRECIRTGVKESSKLKAVTSGDH